MCLIFSLRSMNSSLGDWWQYRKNMHLALGREMKIFFPFKPLEQKLSSSLAHTPPLPHVFKKNLYIRLCVIPPTNGKQIITSSVEGNVDTIIESGGLKCGHVTQRLLCTLTRKCTPPLLLFLRSSELPTVVSLKLLICCVNSKLQYEWTFKFNLKF